MWHMQEVKMTKQTKSTMVPYSHTFHGVYTKFSRAPSRKKILATILPQGCLFAGILTEFLFALPAFLYFTSVRLKFATLYKFKNAFKNLDKENSDYI